MQPIRRIAVIAVLAAPAYVSHAQQQPPQTTGAVRTIQVQPNLYMIAGAGGNVGVQVGPDGVVLVDSGSAPMADAVITAVKTITNQPIRYIINTSADADHVGGNEKVARAGRSIFGGANPGAGGACGVPAAVNNACAASR